MTWFDDLKAEVKAFFEKATKEEVREALERANYAFYKNIDYPILAFHDLLAVYEQLWIDNFSKSVKRKYTISVQIKPKQRISFTEMGVPASADHYGYALAA
jgi:hypothetical protein